MEIVRATAAHFAVLADLRARLWPDASTRAHLEELAQNGLRNDTVVFLALNAPGEAIGFAEASIRHDYVNGCDTSPVAFLEGIYVDVAHRRQRIATALCDAIAQWGAGRGCSELGSDAGLANLTSHALHAHLGFEETERVVFFRKSI
jgi:aminoglycoside 6'-N-acetyltransferase I